MRRLNAELAAEKERTRDMYVALMPPYLADQALSGRLPDSGENLYMVELIEINMILRIENKSMNVETMF